MSTPSRDPGPLPTRVFYSVISLVALVLVGFALYRGRGRANKDAVLDARPPGKLTPDAGAVAGPAPLGASVYRKLDDRTVRMAINVRSAWAPVVYANGGLRAGKEWSTAEGQSFKLDLMLIDDPLNAPRPHGDRPHERTGVIELLQRCRSRLATRSR